MAKKETMDNNTKQRNKQTVIDKLITDNMGYVVSVARQYTGKGVELDDLVSEGTIGMLDAAAKFDTEKGTNFVGYADSFIRKNIEAAIDLQSGLYRIPKKERTATRERQSKAVSIDAPLSEGNAFSLLDVLVNKDSPNPEQQATYKRIMDELDDCLMVLDNKEREVVVNFYGLGQSRLTLAEIGNNLGVKRERARQIRDKAVRKMARSTKNGALRGYLRK
nr:sigma-70 family RNA polymerase sigma factor [Prevotella sp.]